MSVPRYAELARRVLVRAGMASPGKVDPDARARAIEAIAHEIAIRGRRRRMWRRGIASLLVAAFALIVSFGLRSIGDKRAPLSVARAASVSVAQIIAHPVGVGTKVVVSGAQGTLDEGRALGAGSRVVTPPNGRAMLSFSTGTTVLLGEGADMTVAAEGKAQVLRLDAGSIDLRVAKLAADETFLVNTSDSQVEVRGTKFRVSIAPADSGCGGGARTRVSVSEGTVVVRHADEEYRVGAGEQWPEGCSPPPSVASVASISRPASASTSVSSTVPGSTLAEQNDVFAAALAAKRRGDLRTEQTDLDHFLASYPASPLAETAAVERMRLFRTLGSPRLAGAARDYLARYPNGFARAEAEAIVAGTP